jgi:hypothetical protein
VFARELSPSTLVRAVAQHLGTREAVIKWLQSLPQADDFGDERVRVIQCDVPQRVRLFPDDPNCVERSFGALMLLEIIEPRTQRALATVDKPLRHTGLVEKSGDHWHAVDLFPRRNAPRNFDWGSFGKSALHGVHDYVGKPVLKFYLGDTGGKVADALATQEDRLVGDKKPEKKPTPPPAGTQRPSGPATQAQPGAQQAQPAASGFDFTKLFGAGAKQGEGGNDAQKKEVPRGAGLAAFGGTAAATRACAEAAAAGGDRNSHDAREIAQRFWRTLGR